eukprot:389072-Rhodomonas_salina.1
MANHATVVLLGTPYCKYKRSGIAISCQLEVTASSFLSLSSFYLVTTGSEQIKELPSAAARLAHLERLCARRQAEMDAAAVAAMQAQM